MIFSLPRSAWERAFRRSVPNVCWRVFACWSEAAERRGCVPTQSVGTRQTRQFVVSLHSSGTFVAAFARTRDDMTFTRTLASAATSELEEA